MRNQPRVVTRPAQPYLAVAREVTDGVAAAVGDGFAELVARLRRRGVPHAGRPFIRVAEVDRDGVPFAVELGIPVARGTRAGGGVFSAELPPGRYLTLLYTGPYCRQRGAGIDDARLTLAVWAARHRLTYSHATPCGEALVCCVDHLIVGPDRERDHSRWQTELAYLIVGTSGNGTAGRRAAR